MRDKSFFFTFLFFLILSFLIFVVSSSGVLKPLVGALTKSVAPIRASLKMTQPTNEDFLNSISDKLDIKKLQNENNALRDQFETTALSSNALLPAQIIGAPTFIPGVSEPETFVIDKGAEDGVLKGMACVFQDNLVGIITEVGDNSSLVVLVTNSSFSTTIKLPDGTLGVVKGQGKGEMELGNVSPSASLDKNEAVLTKGATDETGVGIIPNIVIGEIVSVDKKPSEIFQKASVRSLLNFSSLSYIFVVLR